MKCIDMRASEGRPHFREYFSNCHYLHLDRNGEALEFNYRIFMKIDGPIPDHALSSARGSDRGGISMLTLSVCTEKPRYVKAYYWDKPLHGKGPSHLPDSIAGVSD